MTDDNVVQFYDATNDSAHIDVPSLLREVQKDIESGMIAPSHCLVLLYTTKPDGSRDTYSYRAQLDKPEEIAMLELFKSMKILEWLGGN